LKFSGIIPRHEYLINFLENNGKNLKEIHTQYSHHSYLIMAKSCPNLKSLSMIFLDNEVIETLKEIFNSCQQLERIKVMCGN